MMSENRLNITESKIKTEVSCTLCRQGYFDENGNFVYPYETVYKVKGQGNFVLILCLDCLKELQKVKV